MTQRGTMHARRWLPAIALSARRLGTIMLCALLAATAGFCSDGLTAINAADSTAGGVDSTTQGTDSTTGNADSVKQVGPAAGINQVALPDSAVPVPPAVRVVGTGDRPVSGVRVVFTVTAGGGTVTGGDVTTDSSGIAAVGSWRLGPTKGVNVLTASVGESHSVSFTATAGEHSPDITSLINEPQKGVVAGDTLQIAVTVTSHYQLASVRAAVGTAQAALSYSAQSGRWEGLLPLQGVPRDTAYLMVTARDINGAATDAFVMFVHDRPPTLTVTAPENGMVVRGSVNLSADCVDDDPAGCSSLNVKMYNDFTGAGPIRTLMTGQSHIGGTASLSDLDGFPVWLLFVAGDSRGQFSTRSRRVYVESSTKLTEIATVDGVAIDLRGDHILYSDSNHVIALQSVTSGEPQILFTDTAGSPERREYGFVTSTGAIFSAATRSSPYTRVLEWRNGALLDLGPLFSDHSLHVSGDYAIFSDGNTLIRRDLAAGTNTAISTSAAKTSASVASNGDVVFEAKDSRGVSRIYRYRDGTTTLLTPDDGTDQNNTDPVTDGVNVVYRKVVTCCDPATYFIVLHDSTGETVLAPPGAPAVPSGLASYVVNGGWMAYTISDAGGAAQVWTRSPTGEVRQVSFFGSSSWNSALADDGTVIFLNRNGSTATPGRRYIVAPGGTAQDLMSGLGTVLWRDGRFVALIQGAAFAITP